MAVFSEVLILDVLLESSSSSNDEDYLKYVKDGNARKKPKVSNFIAEVIDNYSEIEVSNNFKNVYSYMNNKYKILV